jgi:hypothetical protein
MQFTFSRALHMMRYSGAVMQPLNEPFTVYTVIDGDLCWKIADAWNIVGALDSKTIMGSWIEIK